MPLASVRSDFVPSHVAEYRAGRALAEANAPCPSEASPEKKAGWLILQADAPKRIAEVTAAVAAIEAGFRRSSISAACQATLARTSHKPMSPSEAALMGALVALNRA